MTRHCTVFDFGGTFTDHHRVNRFAFSRRCPFHFGTPVSTTGTQTLGPTLCVRHLCLGQTVTARWSLDSHTSSGYQGMSAATRSIETPMLIGGFERFRRSTACGQGRRRSVDLRFFRPLHVLLNVSRPCSKWLLTWACATQPFSAFLTDS